MSDKPRFNHNWTDYARSIGYADERDMLTDMYVVQELSLSQICERLQCGIHTVNRHLDSLGVCKRSRGGHNTSSYQSRKLFYLDQRVVMKWSLLKLARLVGVSTSLVYKYRQMITRQKEDLTWSFASSPQSQDLNDTVL